MSCPQHPPHRAFECFDILCTIFDLLVASEESWYNYDVSIGDANCWYARRMNSSWRSTLACCARVCRSFFTPAVSVLWRDIDNFAQLIPDMRISENRLSTNSGNRGVEYARYVRAVQGFGMPLEPSEQACLASISNQNLEHLPPLPQLRKLRWVQPVPIGTELLHIIPPSLHSLHIIFRKSSEWHDGISGHDSSSYETFVRDLLRGVTTRAPRLRYLRISISVDINESWLELLRGFHELETADLLERIYNEVTTSPLLRPLASMQSLRHLKLRLPPDMLPDSMSGAFPTLQSLTLDAMFARLPTLSAFLSTISSQDLHALSIQNCECISTASGITVREVCDIIRSRFTPSLRKLELSLRRTGPVRAEVTDSHPSIHTIEPLLDMHDLIEVYITIAPQMVVIPASEHDLEKLAEAWPKATRLHLCYSSSSSSTASPSLQDIACFAQHCSVLTDLVLPGIDASASSHGKPGAAAIEPPTAEAVTRSAHKYGHGHGHRLRSLSLHDSGWNSRIPDPTRLAEFLDALFPEVEWRCPPFASEHWRETIQELVRLRIMRML